MKRPAMHLPPHDTTSGEIRGADWDARHDTRVPREMRRPSEGRGEHPARVLASETRPDECPDGRHLWDVIESLIERELEPDEDDERDWWTVPTEELYEVDFRTVLTCVRCGTIREWQGTRKETRTRRVDPVPLVAGDLTAQQVSGDVSEFGRDHSTWSIYRSGQIVGIMQWAFGRRGRPFHLARLYDWPEGVTVEGKDPAAAFRAVVRRTRTDSPVAHGGVA